VLGRIEERVQGDSDVSSLPDQPKGGSSLNKKERIQTMLKKRLMHCGRENCYFTSILKKKG